MDVCCRRIYYYFFSQCSFYQFLYVAGYADYAGHIGFSDDAHRADYCHGKNSAQRHASYDQFPYMAGSYCSGPGAGPRGILVTSLSWHWIFLINIPLGIVCLLLGQRLIPPGVPYVDRHFDSAGFAEIATMSTLLLAAGDMASRGAVYYRPSLVLLAIGLVIGLYFCRHLCRAESPLFSPWPMKIASFRISQTGESFLWLSVGALPYLLTVFLQSYFGWSPVKAGMYILFIFLGNIGIKPFTTFIIEHIRYKKTFYLAFFWILISSLGFALTTPSTPGIILIILAVFSGMGRSLSLTAYNGLCFSELRHEERNDANTLTAVTSNLATGLGISLITVVNAVSAHIAGMGKGYEISFLFLGILMICPIIETSTLPDNIGENTLKR